MPAGSARESVSNPTDLALIATFAAVIALASVTLALPIGIGGVPLTLQTFAIALTGGILGAVRGSLAVMLYLVVGLIGLPVFAGGMAGLAPFLGVTGGYLIAFPCEAFIIGWAASRFHKKSQTVLTTALIIAGILATIMVTLSGAVSISVVAGLSYQEAVIAALVYVPGDVVKVVIAAFVASAVHRAFPRLLSDRL